MNNFRNNLPVTPKVYTMSIEIRKTLRQEAITRSKIDKRIGFKRKDFKNTKSKRWIFDYYGLQGEYAISQFFIENNIIYDTGTKFENSHKKISHDFLVKNEIKDFKVGVKTAIIKRYNSIDEFFRYKKYKNTLFYPYRGKNAQLYGHGYPDILFFCFVFPEILKNKVYIFGYVTKTMIINSKIYKIYNKDTHFINIYHFRSCNQSIGLLKNTSKKN